MVFNRLQTSTRIDAGCISLIVPDAIIGAWGTGGLGREIRRHPAGGARCRLMRPCAGSSMPTL